MKHSFIWNRWWQFWSKRARVYFSPTRQRTSNSCVIGRSWLNVNKNPVYAIHKPCLLPNVAEYLDLMPHGLKLLFSMSEIWYISQLKEARIKAYLNTRRENLLEYLRRSFGLYGLSWPALLPVHERNLFKKAWLRQRYCIVLSMPIN